MNMHAQTHTHTHTHTLMHIISCTCTTTQARLHIANKYYDTHEEKAITLKRDSATSCRIYP